FAFAVKHYLREEDGSRCKDVKPFISGIKSSLPGFINLKEQDAAEKNEVQKKKDRVCWLFKIYERPNSPINHNLPLEISLYISDYISTQILKERISAPISNNLLTNVNTLIECLSCFERILRSPIPLAYSIHLTQTVWIYCLSLPFQMVSQVGWSTIIIVFVATFILLGIERIAAEIENPFGYDPNDLKLGDFCRIIERELKIIISHPPPDIDHWVFDKKNIDELQKRDSYIDSHVKSENETAIEIDKVDDKIDKVSR
ncbi:27026_t:CDS:2, partial [Racocetra persica]